ncbi:hypothetical protein, partial [Streptococcus equi]|uniref:hypothetical protein n=1 Tax=Streptococcus equi TaxID=1336 RepID=UPI001E2A2AD9
TISNRTIQELLLSLAALVSLLILGVLLKNTCLRRTINQTEESKSFYLVRLFSLNAEQLFI